MNRPELCHWAGFLTVAQTQVYLPEIFSFKSRIIHTKTYVINICQKRSNSKEFLLIHFLLPFGACLITPTSISAQIQWSLFCFALNPLPSLLYQQRKCLQGYCIFIFFPSFLALHKLLLMFGSLPWKKSYATENWLKGYWLTILFQNGLHYQDDDDITAKKGKSLLKGICVCQLSGWTYKKDLLQSLSPSSIQ